MSIISEVTVPINSYVLLSEGSNSSPSICENCGYLFTLECFSSEILVDGANAGAVDAAEGAGDPGAVTSSASSLTSPILSVCAQLFHQCLCGTSVALDKV